MTCGATTGPRAAIDLRHLFARQLSLLGSYMGRFAELHEAAARLFDGTFRPVIDTVLPLAEAAEAQRRLEGRGQFGKIVLDGLTRPAGTVPATCASKSQTRRCTLAFAMSFARLSLSLAGVVGVIAAALAAATIWLIMTQPVTIADAVAQGEVSPLVKALAGVFYDALQGLMKYL